MENQVRDLQYKILFHFVPTNNLLYKMKKRNTPNCHLSLCLTEVQTTEHLFYECLIVKRFWLKLWDAVCRTCQKDDPCINIRDVILGYKFHDIDQNREVNTTILHYSFKCYINEKELNIPHFCNYLISYILYFKTLLEGTRNQIVSLVLS